MRRVDTQNSRAIDERALQDAEPSAKELLREKEEARQHQLR